MRFSSIRVGDQTVELESSDRIVQKLERKEQFETATRRLFFTLTRPDSVFIDVGCYSGLFAIAAAKAGLEVIAFEPMEENQRQIAVNCTHNDVEIELHKAAVSDKDGWGTLGYNPNVYLTAGASLDRKSGPKRQVKLMTIDSLAVGNVSLIKIDIEGHEPAALRGARETLERCRPNLIVEANDEAHKKAVIEVLSHGYELIAICDERNLIFSPI